MGVDWQSYLDGSIADNERAIIEQRLLGDESLRAELDGFREFRATLREEMLAEHVPLESLNKSLQKVVRKRHFPILRWAAPLIGATAAVTIWFLANNDPLRLNTTPQKDIVAVSKPAEASNWVNKHVEFEAPTLDLSQVAKLTNARYGDSWACYDYEVGGEIIYLYMSPSTNAFKGAQSIQRDGVAFVEGKGTGWLGRDLAYYIRGGDKLVRARIASAAISQLQSTNRM